MPKDQGYEIRKGSAKPGEPGLASNAADVRRARAPKGSVAASIEANMKAGDGPAKMAAPYDGNTISKVDWDKVGRPQSPSANAQSRNRRGYKEFFDRMKGNG